MNNKHLACLVVGFLIIAMMQWTNVSHQKLKSAQDSEVMSRSAFDSAVIARVAEQRKMVILKNKTESKRNYLNEWSPYINQIKNAQVGEALINMKIKEAKIITLSQVFDSFDREDGSAIQSRLNAQLVLEDDYVKVFNWLAKFSLARSIKSSLGLFCIVSIKRFVSAIAPGAHFSTCDLILFSCSSNSEILVTRKSANPIS